jgi:hypothetical protein
MATTTFTMIVALLFFLAHPRRQKLAFGAAEILAPGSHAANRVSEIAELFRISSPVCLVDSDIHHVDALAFGISGRRTILMGRGLLLLLVKRPNEFDVRLAHEIAHIKNGDVDLGYIALGMVTATKILFACLGIVLAISFGILSLGHFDSRFAIFVVIRDIGALILATILFAGLILPEYRSFLRSREFYADIAASHLFSSASLCTALGEPHSSRDFFRDIYSAHPDAKTRLLVAQNPIQVLEPKIPYFAFIGLLCGAIFAIMNSFLSLTQNSFQSFSFNSSGNYVEVMNGAERSNVLNIALFAIVLCLPFAAALGSLGSRDCIGKILSNASLVQRIKAFLISGGTISVFFIIGSAISPFVSDQIIRMSAEGLVVNWMALSPNPFSLELAGAILGSYVCTNLVFASGFRPSLRGARSNKPGLLWRTFISLLWMYIYLMFVQIFLAGFDFIFAASPAIPLLPQLLVAYAFLILIVAGCWIILRLTSVWIARSGSKSKLPASELGNWAPWLYFQTRALA